LAQRGGAGESCPVNRRMRARCLGRSSSLSQRNCARAAHSGAWALSAPQGAFAKPRYRAPAPRAGPRLRPARVRTNCADQWLQASPLRSEGVISPTLWLGWRDRSPEAEADVAVPSAAVGTVSICPPAWTIAIVVAGVVRTVAVPAASGSIRVVRAVTEAGAVPARLRSGSRACQRQPGNTDKSQPVHYVLHQVAALTGKPVPRTSVPCQYRAGAQLAKRCGWLRCSSCAATSRQSWPWPE
jgi:hypothetical protein